MDKVFLGERSVGLLASDVMEFGRWYKSFVETCWPYIYGETKKERSKCLRHVGTYQRNYKYRV
jgi:hypothetical protein